MELQPASHAIDQFSHELDNRDSSEKTKTQIWEIILGLGVSEKYRSMQPAHSPDSAFRIFQCMQEPWPFTPWLVKLFTGALLLTNLLLSSPPDTEALSHSAEYKPPPCAC